MLVEKTKNIVHEGEVDGIKLIVSISKSGEASGTFTKETPKEGGGVYDQPVGTLNITEVNKGISFHHRASVRDFAAAVSLGEMAIELLIAQENED